MTVRTSVLALFTIAAVAACSDNSATQPMLASRATLSADIGFIEAHPPPPPIDTGAVVETDQGAFTVQTTYFLNKPGNNGFISFANQQADGISVDPNARISLHDGTVSGQGTITLLASGGVITIDLSQAINSRTTTFNPDCSKTCASVGFTGAYTPKGGTTVPTNGIIVVGGGTTRGT
jgi:hypothetical protein